MRSKEGEEMIRKGAGGRMQMSPNQNKGRATVVTIRTEGYMNFRRKIDATIQRTTVPCVGAQARLSINQGATSSKRRNTKEVSNGHHGRGKIEIMRRGWLH